MKVKLLTVCTDPSNEALQALKYSLDTFKYDYEVLVAPEWRGFGTKLLTVYEYILSSDIDAFIFCDAYDCFAIGSMNECLETIQKKYGLDKMVASSERGCWPEGSYEKYYDPILEHGYNYLNSGLYYCPRQVFIDLMEEKMPLYSTDDQLYFTDHYLFNENSNIVLDQNCEVFQCYSFIGEGDYYYSDRLLHNLKTKTMPIIIHGNGKEPLEKIYNLLK